MAIAELPIELTDFLLTNIGKIGLYLQAIGLIVLVWFGFQIVNSRLNYQIRKKVLKIEKDISIIKKLLKKSNGSRGI